METLISWCKYIYLMGLFIQKWSVIIKFVNNFKVQILPGWFWFLFAPNQNKRRHASGLFSCCIV